MTEPRAIPLSGRNSRLKAEAAEVQLRVCFQAAKAATGGMETALPDGSDVASFVQESFKQLKEENIDLHLVAQGIKHYWNCAAGYKCEKEDEAGNCPCHPHTPCVRCDHHVAEARVKKLEGVLEKIGKLFPIPSLLSEIRSTLEEAKP